MPRALQSVKPTQLWMNRRIVCIENIKGQTFYMGQSKQGGELTRGTEVKKESPEPSNQTAASRPAMATTG